MAYEYEKIIKKELEFADLVNADNQDEMLKELQEVYRKAKAFETFIKYKQHVEKYNNSDCHELERVFEFVMKEYEKGE